MPLNRSRIGECPLERVVLAGARRPGTGRASPGARSRPPGSCARKAVFAAKHVQRRPALCAGLGEHKRAAGEIEGRQRGFAASLAPGAFQWSRPAIIRCKTSHSSSSNPRAMRLPSRRSSRTVLPSTDSSGGSNVRSRNGLWTSHAIELFAENASLECLDVDRDVG